MPILTPEERIGTEIAGKYRIRAQLATGGMSVLFAGEHTWTRRPVAIKVLAPHASLDARAVQRFLREARTTTALRHPHVVDVLDMGHAGDGALYIVMELLEGADLSDLIAARGVIPAREAVAIVSPIIDAIAAAHTLGFVHRDIKPGNVFLAKRADLRLVPKLLDFGIAMALADTEPGSTATRTGVILGTPHYMSPEQATSGEVGPASDTWALGVVLYQMLSGVVPFDGGSPTVILMEILRGVRRPLAEMAGDASPALIGLVEQALAPEPSARPQDLRAWARALRAAVGLGDLSTGDGPEVIAGSLLDGVVNAAAAARTSPDAATAQMTPSRRRPIWMVPVAAIALTIGFLSSRRDRSPEMTSSPLATQPAPTPAVAVAPVVRGEDAGARAEPLVEGIDPPEVDPDVAAPRPRSRSRATAPPRATTPAVEAQAVPARRRPVADIDTEW